MLTLGKLLNADAIITGAALEFSEKRLETTAYGVTSVKQNYHLEVSFKEGIHVIKISKGGYIPWENKVKVFQGMQPIGVTLAPVPPPATN